MWLDKVGQITAALGIIAAFIAVLNRVIEESSLVANNIRELFKYGFIKKDKEEPKED